MQTIQYTKRSMIRQHGAKPREVPDDFAQRMIAEGVARIVNVPPIFNPSVNCDHMEEHKEGSNYSITHEMAFWSLVCWVGKPEEELFSVGRECGFDLYHVIGGAQDINKLLLCDLIVVSTDAMELPANLWYMIKICMFQKSTRFVMWAKNVMPYDLFSSQLFNRSELNIFANKELEDEMEKMYGGLFVPSLIESDWHQVWRKISEIC